MANHLGVSNDLLIEVWNQNLLNSLLDPKGDERLKDVITQAMVGQSVWLDEFFSDSKPIVNPSSSSSSNSKGGGSTMSSMYCGESVPTGLSIAEASSTTISGETCGHKAHNNGSQEYAAEEKRIRRTTTDARRMTAQQLADELSSSRVNPHLLVSPHIYGEPFGVGQDSVQPFVIKVHPQVGLITDIHSHLCEAEVIGLLAGKYDEKTRTIYVQFPFPCTSTDRDGDDGSTDVELDP